MSGFTSQSGTLDWDKIFDTGRAVIDVSQSVCDTMLSAFSDFKDPTSRRNVQNQFPMNNGYPQQFPTSYNYGYEERGMSYDGNYGFNTMTQQSNVGGYAGFWNPQYGKGGGV